MTDTPTTARPAARLRWPRSGERAAFHRARVLTAATGVEWTAELRYDTDAWHLVLTEAGLRAVTPQSVGAQAGRRLARQRRQDPT